MVVEVVEVAAAVGVVEAVVVPVVEAGAEVAEVVVEAGAVEEEVVSRRLRDCQEPLVFRYCR